MPVLTETARVDGRPSISDSAANYSGEKLPALTSLRFFAAVMIVICHFVNTVPSKHSGIWHKLALDQGVSFFFVLSGFILFHVYRDLSGKKNTVKFFINRFGRIWPAHFITAILAVLLLSLNPWQPVGCRLSWITWANLAMVHAWVPQSQCYFSINAPSWSISTEFFFYLCFPFLVFKWEQTYIRKFILSCALVLVCIAIATLFWFYGSCSLGEKANHWLLYIGPIARLFEFVLGITTCFIFHRFRQSAQIDVYKATFLELGVLSMVALELFFNPLLTDGYADHVSLNPFLYWLHYCGGAPLYGFLIFVMALQKGLFSKALSLPLFILLGEISYSIYLVHLSILLWFVQSSGFFVRLPVWQSALIYGFTVLVTSFIVYTFIESYFRRAIVRGANKIALLN